MPSNEWEAPDLVPGTRVVIQSLGPPFSGRLGIVETYDKATHAYLVHVDGGNPRHLYRENVRIADLNEEELKLLELNRKVRRGGTGATGRPRGRPRNEERMVRDEVGIDYGEEAEEKKIVEMGDQLLVSIDGEQFTALELLGLKRVDARVLALAVASEEVPKWMQRRTGAGGSVGKFQIGDAVYAQASDGKFYAGKIKHETKEKFLIEWTSEDKKSAGDKWIRKCAVCRRTSLDEINTRPGFFAALAVAAAKNQADVKRLGRPVGRGAGVRGRGLKEEGEDDQVDNPGMEDQPGESEAGVSVADEASDVANDEYESSSCTSDIEHNLGQEISRSTWKHQVLPAIRLLRKVGIAAFSDVGRRETFEIIENRPELEDSFLDWLNVAARQGRSVVQTAVKAEPRPVVWASEVGQKIEPAVELVAHGVTSRSRSPSSPSKTRKRGIAHVVTQPNISASKILKTSSANINNN